MHQALIPHWLQDSISGHSLAAVTCQVWTQVESPGWNVVKPVTLPPLQTLSQLLIGQMAIVLASDWLKHCLRPNASSICSSQEPKTY